MPDLLRFRLLHCVSCGNRDWIIGDDAAHCNRCGSGDWWEDHTFLARDNGPGLAPTPVRTLGATA